MGIENVMYFVLGVLVAGLIALIIIPAVWRRAVRLTKKRIEAATPMTMAEFRADKDQLRAEFALSTRRLEMNVEALRRRLADQLRDINRKKSELGGIKGERDTHLEVVRELEEREGELRRRVLALEKESADLTQKLRMRDREFAEKSAQLDAAREAIRTTSPRAYSLDGKSLSGDYNADIASLLEHLEVERRRAGFLENQNRTLLQQLESSDKGWAEARAKVTDFRERLVKSDDQADAVRSDLVDAEARIADSETRVTELLTQTTKLVEDGETKRDMLLAEKLGLEEEMAALRAQVADVEAKVMADWDTDRIEQSHLRERLNDIAANVSRLVYTLEGNGPPDNEDSLFDRVQKFAGEAAPEPEQVRGPASRQPRPPADAHAVSDRLKALRELQDGN